MSNQGSSAQCEAVLAKMRRKRKGVTFSDFARGFRLAARIFDLREAGYRIQTIKETIGDTQRARYVLLRDAV